MESNQNTKRNSLGQKTLNRGKEAAPEELIKIVKDEIEAFVDGEPQFDDITMLAFRYNGKQDE